MRRRSESQNDPSLRILEEEKSRAKENRHFEQIESEDEDRASELGSYDISTYPADYTLQVLTEKLSEKKIEIPGYQRKFVWSLKQASRLVESFLLNLPVPPIYVYQDPERANVLEVIDGQQRLKSISYFFSGLFGDETAGRRKVFRLTGLNEKSPYSNKTYQELDTATQTRLQDAVLRAFIIRQHNPAGKASVFHVFERLNTGGTLLAGQEIRNCILHGKLNDLLIELNRLSSWRKLFGASEPQKHLRDVELILRFLALRYHSDKYKKPMKDFLTNFMNEFRNPNDKWLAEFRRVFVSTCEVVLEKLGERPFHLRRGLNVAAFDAVFVAVSDNLERVPDDLKTRFEQLKSNSDFQNHIRSATTDESVVSARIDNAKRHLFGTK